MDQIQKLMETYKFTTKLKEANISVPNYLALEYINKEQNVTSGSLSDYLNTGKSFTSMIIRMFLDKEYIQLKTLESDRRISSMTITEKGKSYLDENTTKLNTLLT